MFIPPQELGYEGDGEFLIHAGCLEQYRSTAVEGAIVPFILFNEYSARCAVCGRRLGPTDVANANKNLYKNGPLRGRLTK